MIAVCFLLLSLQFSPAMGGGGDMSVRMEFTSMELCKSVRRAIWAAMPDAKGDIGECTRIAK